MYLGLIDLNTGNLASLESAIKKLDIPYKVEAGDGAFTDQNLTLF